jgi:fermentation-respiration switch protein FrsA (DUF1100 family)
MIKVTSLIFILFLIAIIFSLFYPKIEYFFVYFPDPVIEAVPKDLSLCYEEIWFDTEDNVTLHGWFFSFEKDAPVLLFCHGNAGNMSHRLENIRLLLNHELNVFIFDYRGYGKSEGVPSETGLYLDAQAAYDFLVNTGNVPIEKVVLFGRSLGAAVAIELSLRREAASLIIESGFTSTKEMAKTMLLFNLFSFMLPANFNNLEKIVQVTIPKLIIHGEKDEIVPFAMAHKLFQATPEPKYFFTIKNAGHNDTWLIGGKTYFETLAGFARKGVVD